MDGQPEVRILLGVGIHLEVGILPEVGMLHLASEVEGSTLGTLLGVGTLHLARMEVEDTLKAVVLPPYKEEEGDEGKSLQKGVEVDTFF